MNQENIGNKNAEDGNVKVGATFFEFLTITVKYRWFLFWFVFTMANTRNIKYRECYN